MTGNPVVKLPWRLLCVLGAVILLAACGGTHSQPVLNKSDLVGTWTSSKEGKVTFGSDYKFIATDLRIGSYFSNRCQLVSGSGTWQFLSPQGASGPSLTSYIRGNLISLNFDSSTSVSAFTCTGGGIELTSWKTNSPAGLCLDLDPDSPCTGSLFVRNG